MVHLVSQYPSAVEADGREATLALPRSSDRCGGCGGAGGLDGGECMLTTSRSLSSSRCRVPTCQEQTGVGNKSNARNQETFCSDDQRLLGRRRR